MINLEENKSKIWFKILSENGEIIDGSLEQWSLPIWQQKGDKLNFDKQQASYWNKDKWVKLSGIMGTWLVSNPKELYPSNCYRRIFIAELLTNPSYELPGMIWLHKVRLVREATNLDLKRFGIYRAFKQIIDTSD